ncbi:hypothetical protein [Chryseobacterium gleum]|uniref:hypothetical protein n=1 Tax=Chryseobacterium gleum TaxID=250 RepID=UPI00289EBDBC|nr:hypothetical protein [Chryseobacterium gleum]
MNDYTVRKFELLKRSIDNLRNPHQRDKIRVQIEEFLENISDEKDKREIIDFYQNSLEQGLLEHKEICTSLDNNCVIEGNYEASLFFLKQEKNKIERNNRSSFNNYVENLTITGTGHFVNIGGTNGDIENNITLLKNRGEEDIAEAFNRLKEVANNVNISEEERNLLLDNVNTLSTQATLERSERLPINVIKTIFSGLNVLSSISTVAGVDLQTILGYFNQ